MASTAATAAPIPELELDISLDLDAEVEADSIFRDMTFEEVLEELNARFLVNLPREEMGLVRVYWQAEQAYVTSLFV
jgi:mRNA-decapping enzyme subunit 2